MTIDAPMDAEPMRILFVFARLVAGDEEAEPRLLAQALDPARYRIEAVVCAGDEDLPEQAHARLEAIGVRVDRTPYRLSFEDSVAYLAGLIPGYDAIVSCQDVADIYPALERLHLRPPLIERGRSVAEALAGPKHFTTRYVGASAEVRAAAAGNLPGRERDAILIPPMPAGHAVETVAQLWRRLFDAVRRPPPPPPEPLFRTFWQGGFECSTHRRAHDRRRLDVIAATCHDTRAEEDYRALRRHGVLTVRDGLRWHLIEREPGRYDWSSLEAQLAGMEATGTELIWDLLHYGWPDDLDVWSPAFVTRFAAFAAAAARLIAARTTGTRFYCPINEISFLSWAGGEVAHFNPFARGRGFELKVQLARAAIAAMEAIRADDAQARFVHADPIINVIADPGRPQDIPGAEGHRRAQFQSWDLIAGRMWPQIGGRAGLLDIVGVNYYHNNQWVLEGRSVDRRDPLHKPFHHMLAETYARYGRPIFVAETGIEGEARPAWLAHIADEVRRARRLGVPIAGICLYPILDHPGWDDERPCRNGLLHDIQGLAARQADPALGRELARQRERLSGLHDVTSPQRRQA